MPSRTNKTIIVFAWDGNSIPFKQISFDSKPHFEIVIFNYSGNEAIPAKEHILHYDQLVSIKTEFKGALMLEAYHFLKNRQDITYVAFVDDDLALFVSDINTLLEKAIYHDLDVFQASIDATSYYSHAFNVHKPGADIVYVDWVEIMMPFYRKNIFDELAAFLSLSISSYGVDRYAMPYVQKLLGATKTAVIHTVQIKHTKPVTDGRKIFSNGLTARQEGERVRKAVLKAIRANHIFFTPAQLKTIYEVSTLRITYYKYRIKEIMAAWSKITSTHN